MSEQGKAIIEAVRVVAAQRPHYVYDIGELSSWELTSCVYVLNGCPSCIIGHALWDRGFIGPSMEQAMCNDSDVHIALFTLGIDVDPDEMRWLELVQTAQDRGDRWGDAVTAADEFDISDLDRW